MQFGFPVVKNPPASAGDAGDTGAVSGLRRFLGAENSNPLQYSCLKNPMDRGAGRLQSRRLQRVRPNWLARPLPWHGLDRDLEKSI